jgi:hypothetical protein
MNKCFFILAILAFTLADNVEKANEIDPSQQHPEMHDLDKESNINLLH